MSKLNLQISDILLLLPAARLARKLYENLRREDASIRIQKYARSHAARKSYKKLRSSAIVIQTGLRAMAARNEYRHKRRTKAAIIIQVCRIYNIESNDLICWDKNQRSIGSLIYC